MSQKLMLLSACLLTGTTLFAQKDSTKASQLDEVIVTANKVEQKQSQTGKVITVISQNQLAKSAGQSVAQLLNNQAGVVVNGALNNAGTNQTLYLRGAASGRTLILVDGIPVNDPSFIDNGFDLNLLSVNDIERIEICKGAQSTLYGSDAIAGVINIITIKQHVSNGIHGKISSTVGNLQTSRNNLQVYGKTKKWQYNAKIASYQAGGFSVAQDTLNTGKFDNDGYKAVTASANVIFKPAEQTELKAFAIHGKNTIDADASAFTDKRNYTVTNNSWYAGIGAKQNSKNVSFVFNYQLGFQKRKFDDNASVLNAKDYYLDNYNGQSHFGEIFATIKIFKGLQLLVGADQRVHKMNSNYISESSWGTYTGGFSDTSLNLFSAYASAMYHYAGLDLEAGVRYNKHSRYGENYTHTVNASKQIGEHFRIFAGVSSGYKAPSLYQLYAIGSGNTALKPELANSFEVGVEQRTKEFTERLVYFERTTNDGIDYNDVNYSYYNFNRQKVKGLEYEINVKLSKEVAFSGNYTYLTGNESLQSRETNKDTTYTYLLRRPKHTANATLHLQPVAKFNINFTGKYIHNRYDVGGYKKGDVKLNSYWLLSAYAEYLFTSNIKWFVDAQNILNKKFHDLRGYNSIPFVIQTGIAVNW